MAVDHLQSFHLILCISKLHHKIMKSIAEELVNIRQIYLSLPTYVPLGAVRHSVRTDMTTKKIRFVALNVNQLEKGSSVLLREFQEMRAHTNDVELHFFGNVAPSLIAEVFFHGAYKSTELDSILSTMDVGIIPSVWPEAYAYVGPEMLQRGIPLIVSSVGAMTEYVTHNVNGLHFDPNTPGDLARAMRSLVSDSDLLHRLRTNALASQLGIVSFADHIDAMEAIYAELCLA